VDWVYERHTVFQELGWIFKRRGMPWILEVNGPLFYEAKVERNSIVLHKLARRLEIRAYRRCDILVSVTEAGKEIAIREAGIRPEKVVVLPNGVDTALLDPERHEPEEVFDNFTIGFAGSLLPWQALGLLLETLRDMRKEGADISLLVVGDGSMRKAWEAQARQLGISENVLFTGWMPWQEVPRFISGFDVGYSGQTQMQVGSMYHSPLKIYEYMAMGKPVVASAFEDAKRVVRDRETGFLFEDGDKASLKRALSEAYGSRDTLPEMGRKAREEVVAHHSWTARVRTLISEIERILRSGP
jgi:glycosyltransferase involved in cell wall biosynthesis